MSAVVHFVHYEMNNVFVKAFILFKWEFFLYKNQKKRNFLSGKIPCTKA